jgi:hypothetical protein
MYTFPTFTGTGAVTGNSAMIRVQDTQGNLSNVIFPSLVNTKVVGSYYLFFIYFKSANTNLDDLPLIEND